MITINIQKLEINQKLLGEFESAVKGFSKDLVMQAIIQKEPLLPDLNSTIIDMLVSFKAQQLQYTKQLIEENKIIQKTNELIILENEKIHTQNSQIAEELNNISLQLDYSPLVR